MALAQLGMKTKVTLGMLVDVAYQLDAMRDSPAMAASAIRQAQALALHLSRAAEHDGMCPYRCLTSLHADSVYSGRTCCGCMLRASCSYLLCQT